MSWVMTQTLAAPLPVFHDRDCAEFVRRLGLALGVLMLLAVPAQGQDRSLEARIAAFARCPALNFPPPEGDDVRLVLETLWAPPNPIPPQSELRDPSSWVAPESAIDRHKALRARAGVSMPSGEQQVLVFEVIAHSSLGEISLVASRNNEGRWSVDELAEFGVGGNDAAIRHRTWTLPWSDGFALDDELADPCVDAEPLRSTHAEFSLDLTYVWTLETTGRQPTLRVERHYWGFGRASRIRDLLHKGSPR